VENKILKFTLKKLFLKNVEESARKISRQAEVKFYMFSIIISKALKRTVNEKGKGV